MSNAMSTKTVQTLGWIAATMCIASFLSYTDQIRLNLSGHPGSFLLPAVTFVNCLAWIAYGASKNQKDWPLIVCNLLGIIVTGITAATAVLA